MDARTLPVVLDVSLQIAGLAAILVACAAIAKNKEKYLSLSLKPAIHLGPGLFVAGLVTFSYFLFQSITLLFLPVSSGMAPISPGTNDWNLVYLAESAARLAATALIVLFFVLTAEARREPGAHWQRNGNGWKVAAIAFLASLPICYSQNVVCEWLWELLKPGNVAPDHQVLLAFGNNEWGIWGKLLLVAIVVVIAPVTEELYFRGLILGGFAQLTKSGWLSVALSSVAFGFVHVSQPQVVAPIITLGFILGYIRLRLNSISLCIAVHALFNARTMALLWLDPSQVPQVH